VIRYRVGGGRSGVERMHTIGRYGPLTADKARDLAKLALADVAAGGDPQGGRAATRAEMTLADLCDLYLAEGCATKKASTLATDQGRIARHIKPLLGRKRVSAVAREDVERFLADVAAGKTATTEKTKARGKAVVTGGKGTATRTLGLLGSILGFAVDRKLRADNPARGVRRFKDRKCERFLSPSELGRLGAALEAMEAEGAHPYGIAIIRLLAFTGARRSEIEGLRWREIDFDRGLLRLEDSKTGQKTLTLSPGAAAILAGVSRVAGSDFVFPAASGGDHYQGAAKVWIKARALAGLEDVRLHDLRHTFASFGAGGGFGLPVIGALLGHRNATTTQRYAHLADDPLRKANDWIGGEIGAALSLRAVQA
jgi:integrase